MLEKVIRKGRPPKEKPPKEKPVAEEPSFPPPKDPDACYNCYYYKANICCRFPQKLAKNIMDWCGEWRSR